MRGIRPSQLISPHKINFSQCTVSDKLGPPGDKKLITAWQNINIFTDPVIVLDHDGHLIILDNRRLYASRHRALVDPNHQIACYIYKANTPLREIIRPLSRLEDIDNVYFAWKGLGPKKNDAEEPLVEGIWMISLNLTTLGTLIKYRCARQGSAFSLQGESTTFINPINVSNLPFNQNTFRIYKDRDFQRPIRSMELDTNDILNKLRDPSCKWSSYPKKRWFSRLSLGDTEIFNAESIEVVEPGFLPYALFKDEGIRGGADEFDDLWQDDEDEVSANLYHDILREDEIWSEIADSITNVTR